MTQFRSEFRFLPSLLRSVTDKTTVSIPFRSAAVNFFAFCSVHGILIWDRMARISLRPSRPVPSSSQTTRVPAFSGVTSPEKSDSPRMLTELLLDPYRTFLPTDKTTANKSR